MRHTLAVLSMVVLVGLSGCEAIQTRAASAPVRHPCGNIWNICPEETYGLQTITAVLNGRN